MQRLTTCVLCRPAHAARSQMPFAALSPRRSPPLQMPAGRRDSAAQPARVWHGCSEVLSRLSTACHSYACLLSVAGPRGPPGSCTNWGTLQPAPGAAASLVLFRCCEPDHESPSAGCRTECRPHRANELASAPKIGARLVASNASSLPATNPCVAANVAVGFILVLQPSEDVLPALLGEDLGRGPLHHR